MPSRKKVSIAIAAKFDQAFDAHFMTASDKMSKLGKKGAQLTRELGSVETFQKTSKKIAELGLEAKTTSEKVDRLSSEIKAQKASFNAASQSVRKLTADEKKLRSEMELKRIELRKAKLVQQEISEAQKKLSGKNDIYKNKLRKSKQQVLLLSEELHRSKQVLNEHRGKLEEERRVLEQGKDSLVSKRRELSRAEKEHRDVTRAVDRESDALRGLSGYLKKAGVDTDRLSAEQKRLSHQLEANERRFRRVARAKRLSEKEGLLRSDVASRATSLAIQGAGAAFALAPATRFEDRMASVKAVTSATSNEFDKLSKLARNLGRGPLFNASKVADAQTFLGMAGFEPEKIEASLKDVLDVAAAGKMDLAETSDIASNILSGFGIDAGKMKKVADVMAGTFTTANVDIRMLGETMKYVAPIASQAGASIEQVAAAAGLLGNVGLQGSMAGTAIRAVFNRLAAPPKAALEELKKMGIDTLDPVTKNLRSIPEILKDIAKATKGAGSGTKLKSIKKIFGEEAAAGASELVKQAESGELDLEIRKLELAPAYRAAIKSLKDLADKDLNGLGLDRKLSNIDLTKGLVKAFKGLNTKELKKKVDKVFAGVKKEDKEHIIRIISESGSGDFNELVKKVDRVSSAQKLAEERTGKATKAFNRLKNAAEDLATSLGQTFLPALSDAANKLSDGINVVSKFADEHPKLVKALGFGAAAMWTASAATLAYKVANLGLIKVLKGAKVAQFLLNNAMRASVIGLIVTGISLAVAYSDELLETWNMLTDKFTKFWNDNIEKINMFAKILREVANFMALGALDRFGIAENIDLTIKSDVNTQNKDPETDKVTDHLKSRNDAITKFSSNEESKATQRPQLTIESGSIAKILESRRKALAKFAEGSDPSNFGENFSVKLPKLPDIPRGGQSKTEINNHPTLHQNINIYESKSPKEAAKTVIEETKSLFSPSSGVNLFDPVGA